MTQTRLAIAGCILITISCMSLIRDGYDWAISVLLITAIIEGALLQSGRWHR